MEIVRSGEEVKKTVNNSVHYIPMGHIIKLSLHTLHTSNRCRDTLGQSSSTLVMLTRHVSKILPTENNDRS